MVETCDVICVRAGRGKLPARNVINRDSVSVCVCVKEADVAPTDPSDRCSLRYFIRSADVLKIRADYEGRSEAHEDSEVLLQIEVRSLQHR